MVRLIFAAVCRSVNRVQCKPKLCVISAVCCLQINTLFCNTLMSAPIKFARIRKIWTLHPYKSIYSQNTFCLTLTFHSSQTLILSGSVPHHEICTRFFTIYLRFENKPHLLLDQKHIFVSNRHIQLYRPNIFYGDVKMITSSAQSPPLDPCVFTWPISPSNWVSLFDHCRIKGFVGRSHFSLLGPLETQKVLLELQCTLDYPG
jgi:hypothetical protein